MALLRVLVLCLASLWVCLLARARVVQLVDAASSVCSESDILLAGEQIGRSASTAVISSLARKYALDTAVLNDIFQTSFVADEDGVQLDSSPLCGNCMIMHATVPSLNEGALEGAKIVDFCQSMSDVVCVSIPAEDLRKDVQINVQVLQGLLRERAQIFSQESEAYSKPLLSVFVFGSSEKDTSEYMTTAAEKVIQEAWEEIGVQDFLVSDLLELKIFAVPSESAAKADAIELAKDTIEEWVQSQPIVRTLEVFASTAPDSWSIIGQNPPRRVLTKKQRASLYRIEAAYDLALRRIDSHVESWRARVDSQRIVGKFGDRVMQLLNTTLATYDAQTLGVVDTQLRVGRRAVLVQVLQEAVSGLFRLQMALLQSDVMKKLKRALVKIARSSEGLTEDEQALELRKSEFWFDSRANELEVPSFNLTKETSRADVSETLQELVSKFPESPAAQLEAMKKLERRAKTPKSGKSVRMGLSLVGMLRPPGNGNLQGFVGYTFAPHSQILVGFANDGDTVSALLGEASPLLRVQPKLHFDVDA